MARGRFVRVLAVARATSAAVAAIATAAWAAVAAVAVGGAGCAVDSGSEAGAIRGGMLDGDHAAVVAIGGAPAACGQALEPSCSGTMVGPRAVLTAAHCVTRRSVGLMVSVGASAGAPLEERMVADAWVHPDFDDRTNANDVAVLLLDRAATAPVAAMAATAIDAGRVGEVVTLVGFGVDGLGAAPGERRAGTARIDAVGTGAAAGTFDVVPDPALSCDGDSGGPVLADEGGGEVVAGITSSGDAACLQRSTNLDVSAYRGFIDAQVAAAAAAPPVHGDGPIALDAICDESCGGDQDCPAGLACTMGLDGERRCAAPGLAPGVFLDGCVAQAGCATGMCARLPGRETCACYQSCDSLPQPEPGCGCGSGGGEGSLQVLLIALLLGLGRAWRERAMSRS